MRTPRGKARQIIALANAEHGEPYTAGELARIVGCRQTYTFRILKRMGLPTSAPKKAPTEGTLRGRSTNVWRKWPRYTVSVQVLRAAGLAGSTTLAYRAEPGRIVLEAAHA